MPHKMLTHKTTTSRYENHIAEDAQLKQLPNVDTIEPIAKGKVGYLTK
jgi:hypothetical protein